jgi:hypothetical protein
MAKALGQNEEEEYQPRLSDLAQRLTGADIGLLFTNEPLEKVQSYVFWGWMKIR